MDTTLDDRPDDSLSHRLWTPWRMTYIGGETKETGCIFCNRLQGEDDVASLILHRSSDAFIIMNLFPYNTGHVMIVPNAHVASPEVESLDSLTGMSLLLPPVLRALRRVLTCHGFNIGFNVGAVAGAGVAEHLHQHVVPRWTGDANFMPIIASTMVIPELIPVAYAKIRAELHREVTGASDFPLVVLDRDQTHVWTSGGDRLPSVSSDPELPIWRTAANNLVAHGIPGAVAGWAGARKAIAGAEPGLTCVVPEKASQRAGWVALTHAADRLAPTEFATVQQALNQLAPSR